MQVSTNLGISRWAISMNRSAAGESSRFSLYSIPMERTVGFSSMEQNRGVGSNFSSKVTETGAMAKPFPLVARR